MKILPVFVVLFFLTFLMQAHAYQVILDAWRDSNIATYNDDNYGYNTILVIGENNQMWYPLIEFNLSSFYGVIVESAFLRLYVYDAEGIFPPTDIWIGRIIGSWDETTVTWYNFPGADDSTFVGGPDSIGDWWVMDVTSYVNSWVSGSYGNYGFILGTLDYRDNCFGMFSRDYDFAGYRPKLELNYHDVYVDHVSLGNIKAIFK